MIRYVSGDLLAGHLPVIAHGVAPNDPFSQGLAHALREQFPAMYKDFRHYCQTSHPKEGGLWTWGGAGGRRVVALFTQGGAWGHGGNPGRASTSNVNHALKALAQEVRQEGWTQVAMPRLATGIGGLDWADVKPPHREAPRGRAGRGAGGGDLPRRPGAAPDVNRRVLDS